jgi:hypothetical protein
VKLDDLIKRLQKMQDVVGPELPGDQATVYVRGTGGTRRVAGVGWDADFDVLLVLEKTEEVAS